MVSKSFSLWKEGCIYKASKENIVGIDVSKSKLDCSLIDNLNHEKINFKMLPNFEEGLIVLVPT